MDTSRNTADQAPGTVKKSHKKQQPSYNTDPGVVVAASANTAAAPTAPKLPFLIYQCDECRKSPLQGSRWRCSQCPDFDLCIDCFRAKKHDQTHVLSEIPIVPSAVPVQQLPASTSSRSASYTESALSAYLFGSAPSAQQQQQQQHASGTTTPPLNNINNEETGVDRPRRVIKPSAPHLNDPMQRMEYILTSTDLGTIPMSQVSTATASMFMQLYDAGWAAMERHKSSKAHAQIVGRIALALSGIPRRRPGAFQVHEVATPLEQETVTGVMSSLVGQIQVLDSNNLFAKPMEVSATSSTSSSNIIPTERVDLTTIADNVEKGKYFKGVDLPEIALALFQRHILSVWANVARTQPPEHTLRGIASRLDRLSRNAIAEIRDALGVASIVEPLAPNDSPAAGGYGGGGEAMTNTTTTRQVSGGGGGGKRQRRSTTNNNNDADFDADDLDSNNVSSGRPTTRVATIEMIKSVREEIKQVNQRLDQLVTMLQDKLVGGLSKGLDRLSRG